MGGGRCLEASFPGRGFLLLHVSILNGTLARLFAFLIKNEILHFSGRIFNLNSKVFQVEPMQSEASTTQFNTAYCQETIQRIAVMAHGKPEI